YNAVETATVRVYCDDTTPPALTIDSPQDGAEVPESPITVTGAIDDNNARVTVNNVSAVVANNAFAAENIYLMPGLNTITATARDQKENTSTTSITVTCTKAVHIAITSPAAGATIYRPEVTVEGTYEAEANDIGIVVNGITVTVTNGTFSASIPLSEGQNTITATATDEYGQTASDSITVTLIYLTPTVSISATPETIQVGESATLSWSSTNADTAGIEPGIGPVDPNGSTTVSPTEITTYTITAKGPGGTATVSVTVTVISPISLQITSPSDGEWITGPDILVQGTLTNATGNETGVTVNGIMATVYGDHFMANHVPLQEGENTLTVTATDIDGNTASASTTVYVETTGDYIRITANPVSGISPLETTLSIDGSFSFTESSLTCTGPGDVEFLGSTSDEYNVRMTVEGIYYFTAEVTDDQSNTYTDTVAIIVLDEAELDALLSAKWNGMKQALVNGDIEGALEYFHEKSRAKYGEIFTLLQDEIGGVFSSLGDMELIYLKETMAKYRIRRYQTIEGQDKWVTYYIYFVKDPWGIWKIRSF
ncbi:MAG: hypothetical protein ABIF87_13415, partial [Pseudomonadota bacterium]